MKMRKFTKRQYFLTFAFVMTLNFLLAALLLTSVFSQVADDKLQNQPPLQVEVSKQYGRPLDISIVGIDTSNVDFQSIRYSVTNISDKSIRAYTVVALGKSTGKITTRYLTEKLFQSNGMADDELSIERQNIKLDERLHFGVDYVEFEDGSSWGKDDHMQSENIAGERAGRSEAIRKIRDLINSGDFQAASKILGQEISKITVPEASPHQTERWRRGFQLGFRSTISVLKRVGTQDVAALSVKVSEMEKLVR